MADDTTKLKIDLSMDRVIKEYPISALPTKLHQRTDKAKQALFEEIDINLYNENAHIVTFYTSSDRIQAWIKTLDIYYYDNLGKDQDLEIEWRDDPIEWKDPNNSANSIVIEILKNEQLQYNVTFFVTTGTIRVQGTCYRQFAEVHFPKLKNIFKMVLANMSQSVIQDNNPNLKCSDDNLDLEASNSQTELKIPYTELMDGCKYAYNAHKIRHRKV
jgi:hypothetical protein